MINAFLIDSKDGVVTLAQAAKPGDTVCYKSGEKTVEVTALDNIPIYHKMAIKPIKKNEDIIKYGQLIAIAGCDIQPGQHVHMHNVVEPERK